MKTAIVCACLMAGLQCATPPTAVGQNGSWTVYDTRSSDICGNNISALAADAKGVWAGTYQGLCHMSGTSWMDYSMFNQKLKDQSVNCLTLDDHGILWVGTDDYGVIEWDGTNWTEHSDITHKLKMKFVKEIVKDKDGVKWIGLTLVGVVSYDGHNWEKYTPDDSELLSDFVLDLAVDRANRKWITTNGGVSVFNGSRWTGYTSANSGLPDDIVPAIVIDKDNVKWFGTLGGLARFDGQHWTVWTSRNSPLPSDQVNDIAIDENGLLWIATSAGAAVFDGLDQWVSFTSKNSLIPAGNIYKVACNGRGTVWFGNDARGLAKLTGFKMPAKNTSHNPALQQGTAVADNGDTRSSSRNFSSEPSDEKVRIIPHLDEGYITISMESPVALVSFINASGKVVKTTENYMNNQHIKINRLPKGMYTVSVKTERGERKIKFNLK